MAEYKAKISFLRIAPRKVRLVADLIRGMDVTSAEQQLNFSLKRAAAPLAKVLRSAAASAGNDKAAEGNLKIKDLRVDQGPVYRRFRARARGRAAPIKKRTSHISLVLAEREKHEALSTKSETIPKSK